jgi:hypothetical protein
VVYVVAVGWWLRWFWQSDGVGVCCGGSQGLVMVVPWWNWC